MIVVARMDALGHFPSVVPGMEGQFTEQRLDGSSTHRL